MRRYNALALVVAVAVAGCDSADPQGGAEPIFPLAVGNTWAYTAVSFDSGGVPLDTTRSVRGVFADSLAGDETWYAVGSGETLGDAEALAFAPGASLWFTLREDGLWRGRPGSDAPVHELPYPAEVGATNRPRVVDGRTEGGGDMTLVSTDTTVTVPAGTFRCYHYQYRNAYMSYADDHFYAPGVGRVLSVGRDYFEEVYVRTRSELTAYQVSE